MKYFFMLIIIGGISALAQSQDVAKSAQVDSFELFDELLETIDPQEAAGMYALANMYLTLPEASEHQRDVRAILAKKFKSKFGVTVETALQENSVKLLNTKPAQPTVWAKLLLPLITLGVPAITVAIFSLWNQRPVRMTAEMRGLEEALPIVRGVAGTSRRGG